MDDRIRLAASDVTVRSRCAGHWIGDSRADSAFDLVLLWCHTNSVSLIEEHGRHVLCRAVEIRGRNDNVSGGDFLEWDQIVNHVVNEFVKWLAEARAC